MMKKIILFALVSLTITSCSTYNGFAKRRYFDFSRSTAAIVNKVEKSTNVEESVNSNNNSFNESNNLSASLNDGMILVKTETIESSIPQEKHPVSNFQTKSQSVNKTKLKSESENSIKNKTFQEKKQTLAPSEHCKGRFWWIFAIGAFIGLIFSLFLTAYLGLILALGCLTLMVIFLIKYLKSA